MTWMVGYTKMAEKQQAKLPEKIKAILDALTLDIRSTGPVQGRWPNYSKLTGNRHHCHLNDLCRRMACK